MSSAVGGNPQVKKQRKRSRDPEDDRNKPADGACTSPSISGLLRYFPPTNVARNEAKKDTHVASSQEEDAPDISVKQDAIEDTASNSGMSDELHHADEVSTDSQDTIDGSQQRACSDHTRESRETSSCSSCGGSDEVGGVSLASGDDGRRSRPKRQVVQRIVSYVEDAMDDESSNEEQNVSFVMCGRNRQNNFAITRYFSPQPTADSQSNQNSENQTVCQEATTEDQSQLGSESEHCVVPMIETVSPEIDDGSGMETDTIQASQSSCENECIPQPNGGETTAEQLQCGMLSSQTMDDAVVPSVCVQAAESDLTEGCDKTDHLPITAFFRPIVKPSQQPPGTQADERTAEDEEETEEEAEQEKRDGEESEQEATVNDDNEDEDEDTCEEEEGAHKQVRKTYNVSMPGVPESIRVTRFFTPVVKRIKIPERKETDEKDEEETDDGSSSDQSKSVKTLEKDTDEQEDDDGANSPVMEYASDEENWDAITEVCPSSKRRKRSNSRIVFANREINTSALLSRIRKAQRSAARQARRLSTELSWSLEVDVTIRSSSPNNLNKDCSSSEESSDEDYTRIMQEEESVLLLHAPVLGCEPNFNEDKLIDETDDQQSGPELQYKKKMRKRKHPLSIPDSDDDRDDLNCVSQNNITSVRQRRGRVSDSDFSGGSDSGLGGSADGHPPKIEKNEKAIRQCLVSEEENDDKKCKAPQQERRKKIKRRRLISKQERQEEETESENHKDTAIDTGADIAGKVMPGSYAHQLRRRSARLAAQNQSVVDPDGSGEVGADNCITKNVEIAPVFCRQERKKAKSGRGEPDKLLDMNRGEVHNNLTGLSQKPPTELFPVFCKPTKESRVGVEVNSPVCPLVDSISDCSELGRASSLPQRKVRKNTDSQTPAVSYMPFPEVSHVLQYDAKEGVKDVKLEGNGFVVSSDTLTVFDNDGFIWSRCGGDLELGTLTSCQCKNETSVTASSFSIGEEKRQELLKDLARVASSVDVYSTYEKYLQEYTANSNTNSSMWTDMFAPSNSDELAVNRSAVCKLQKWLSDWEKSPRNVKERRKDSPVKSTVPLDKKRELEWLDDDDDDFIVIKKRKQRLIDSDSESEEEEDTGCKAVLLLGHYGSGKTAAVYACAKELGWTVIELNASSKRSGKTIQANLIEATRSHHVSRTDMLDSKAANVKLIHPNSHFKHKERKPTKPLLHPSFASFIMNGTSREGQSHKNKQDKKLKVSKRQKTARQMFSSDSEPEMEPGDTEAAETKACGKTSPKLDQNEETEQPSGRPMAKAAGPTVVLLDEVDIVFESDGGFWAAVSSIVETTKRPVIMTALDDSVMRYIEFQCEVIQFEPSEDVQAQLISLLQLMCLAEGIHVDLDVITALVNCSRGDIRRCIHTVQFWCSTATSPAFTSSVSSNPTSIPRHLDLMSRIPVGLPMSFSTDASLNKDTSICDNQFMMSCESFNQLSEIDFMHGLEVETLFPFLFTESQSISEGNPAAANIVKDTLAQWCDLNSAKDIFRHEMGLTEPCVHWQCHEQPSLIDSLPVHASEVEKLLTTELCSSLTAASVNYLHIQFANHLPNMCSVDRQNLLDVPVPQLIERERNLERHLASRKCLFDRISTSLPTHLQCSREVIATDYLPVLRAICSAEAFKEQTQRRARRSRHHFHDWMDSDLQQALARGLADTPQMV